MILTVAEWAVVLPFIVFISAILLGADGDNVRLPFLVAEVLGILLYMAEIRDRFKYRNGGRQ